MPFVGAVDDRVKTLEFCQVITVMLNGTPSSFCLDGHRGLKTVGVLEVADPGLQAEEVNYSGMAKKKRKKAPRR